MVFQVLPRLCDSFRVTESVPTGAAEQIEWLRAWTSQHIRLRAERFRTELIAMCGEEDGTAIEFAEMYEVSEYARQPDATLMGELFPGALALRH